MAGNMATGNQMGAYAEDQLTKLLKQKQMEQERDQRIAGMQRAATMAQHMHPETMAGMLVGQLLGDAIGRWMNGGGGHWDGSGKTVDVGSKGSAGDIIANEMRNERNEALSGELLKGMLPDQYNAQQNAKMEAFVSADPSQVQVYGETRFPWEKPKEEEAYSFHRYAKLPYRLLG